jgi:hypothetical protein
MNTITFYLDQEQSLDLTASNQVLNDSDLLGFDIQNETL